MIYSKYKSDQVLSCSATQHLKYKTVGHVPQLCPKEQTAQRWSRTTGRFFGGVHCCCWRKEEAGVERHRRERVPEFSGMQSSRTQRHMNGNLSGSCTWSHAWSTNQPVTLELCNNNKHNRTARSTETLVTFTKTLNLHHTFYHVLSKKNTEGVYAWPCWHCCMGCVSLSLSVLSVFSLLTACSTSQPLQWGGQRVCLNCVGEEKHHHHHH